MNSLTYLYDTVFRRSLKRKQQPEASPTSSFLPSSSSTIEHMDDKSTHPNKKHNNGKSKLVNTTGDCNVSIDVAHDANKEKNKVSTHISKIVDEVHDMSNKGKGRATITMNNSINNTR